MSVNFRKSRQTMQNQMNNDKNCQVGQQLVVLTVLFVVYATVAGGSMCQAPRLPPLSQ